MVDDGLAPRVALVRRVVELGRSARAGSKVRNRQPLGRALVGARGWADLPEELQLAVTNIDDPSALCYLIAGALRIET